MGEVVQLDNVRVTEAAHVGDLAFDLDVESLVLDLVAVDDLHGDLRAQDRVLADWRGKIRGGERGGTGPGREDTDLGIVFYKKGEIQTGERLETEGRRPLGREGRG